MKKLPRLLLAASCALGFSAQSVQAADNELYFYNWSEYIPTEVLTQFTEETGIKVIYSTYESNESMYAKLKTHPEGYDLVVPSTYFVSKMRNEGMLKKLDHSKLSNFANIDESYLNKSFDPNNDYSIPYIWGATGIGVNAEMLDESEYPTSWADLWDPKWEGQLMVMDDSREFFHIALRKLGYSGNTTDEAQIKAAYEELKSLMPNVLVFNSDFPANPYMSGETPAGMLWNGSAYAANQEDADLKIIWPKEGAIFWMDSLSIPANAKNIDAAYKMINFLLRPENAAKLAVEIGYPTPVKAAYPLLPNEFVENKNVYPSAEVIANGEWQNSVGSASDLYEEYFQKLKSGL